MSRHIRNLLASLTLPFALGLPQAAHAYTHPGALLNLADLQSVKTKIENNQQPWKYAYDDFAMRQTSSYGMRGPTAIVSRSPDVNLHLWKADMTAIWNLSLMWYFTGDNAYAQKAHDVLLAWANTQTEFSGNESMLTLGDYAPQFVGGAEILRGTWPGWTAADTTAVKAYFANVLMPGANPWGESMYGAANKGALAMMAQGLMGIFNDDTVTVDRIAYQARTLAHVGLRSSNDIGMLGDSLRDQGHANVQLNALTVLAEALWKQGIDIYSDYDNRLLAAGEYYARVNDLSVTTPWLPFGSTDAYYQSDVTNRGWGAGPVSILHNAYVVRKGLKAPNITRRLQETPPDWLFLKDADLSTAAPAPTLTIPATTSITSGFSDVDIANTSPVGNSSYSGGIWTVQGAGWNIWSTGDDCHFTYKAITGDCAIIAKVESVQNTHQSARAGVMLRTSLSAGSPRVWMAVTPSSNIEQNIQGIAVYAGSNYGNKVAAGGIPQPSYWVKLERLGDIVTGSISPDGTNWAATEIGRLDNSPDTWYVGLMVSATAGVLNTSTFSNVQITGGNGGAPIVTPAAPAAFLAMGGENAVSLRWQSSFGATGYTIKRATTSGGTYSTIASGVTGSSYTDTTVTNGTTYYYVVNATNSAGTSANSAEDSATPFSPMVNIAFGGTATSSAVGAPSWDGPSQAFIRNSGWKWTNASASNPGPTGWLRYDFRASNAQTVKRYTVISADQADRDPKTWTFQGSNDGSTWTTLDTQSNQAFANRNHAKVYNISNTTAYRYYQIDVTANNGGTALAIAELGLWSDTGRTIPDGTYRILNRKSKKVMDVSSGSIADGAQLVQWTYGGGNSQQWDMAWQPANGQYRATGVASAKVIDNGGTSTAGANLVIQPWNEGTSQLWKVVPDSDTFYHFTSANSSLVADVNGGSTADGANIIQWTYSGSANQQWMPLMISAAPTAVGVISVDFIGGGSTNGTPALMGAAEVAGVPAAPVANWTSVSGASGTLGSLKDHTGAATSASVNWSCNNTWSSPIAESAGDYRMMKGYLDTSNTSTTSVGVSGIPSSYQTSGYKVYVYLDGDNSTLQAGIYTVAATSLDANDAASTNFSGTYVQANDSAGNYVVFTGLTSASFTLTATPDTAESGVRAPVNGIQIVSDAWTPFDTTSPTGLSATAASASQINLSWTASSGATSYNVKRATTSGGPYTTIATGVTGTTYSNTGLSASTTYYYVVSAVNATGESGNSAQASATTQAAATPPSAPTGLNATAASASQINLAWTASSGAGSYNVKRATTSGGPYTTIATGVTGTTYSNTGLAASTTYYYVVSAVNATGESGNSSQASATTQSVATVPAAPSNLGASPQGKDKVNLSWSDNSTDETKFEIERSLDGSTFAKIAEVGANTTAYQSTGLTSKTTYYYRVRAANANGASAYSNTASARTK